MYHYKLSPLVAAVTALSLIFSAYFAETFRAGWNAVDKGQREAAWSIGLSGFTQFRRIIFPQAAVSALPNFTSVLIDLIKDTSLVYTITVIDLMAKANIAAARGFHFVEAYCVVLVIYIVLCLAIARALRSVERFRAPAGKETYKRVFHGYHFGEGILKNKILLVSALTLAMGINAAQAVEKVLTRRRLRLSLTLTVFPLALLTITTILPATMAIC